MAIPKNDLSLEKAKFVETTSGDTAVRVKLYDNSALVSSTFDAISTSYPSGTSEVYYFKQNGRNGTTVATVTVVYTDSSKELIDYVEKS